MAFAHALEEACAGHDASRTHEGAIRCDYLSQLSASSPQFEWRKALCRTLDERTILLAL
jgi:hypothetical protein